MMETLLVHVANILVAAFVRQRSPRICSANQWTDFYMITASIMKELSSIFILVLIRFMPLVPFFTPPQKKTKFSDIFGGYKKKPVAKKWLTDKYIVGLFIGIINVTWTKTC